LDIPILKLAMWQHVMLCVLSFAQRALDCACHSLCYWRLNTHNTTCCHIASFNI